MGSPDVETFWEEAWENLRWGGRTHTLSYECKAEAGLVFELAKPGMLESVSDIEEVVGLANLFQRAPVKSSVAVVMGYPAAINWTVNTNEDGVWNMAEGAFCDAFRTACELFKAGYVCDLISSYEIDDGDLAFRNGKVVYGSETYDALVYVRPEFSKQSTFRFLETLARSDFPLAVLGACDSDSDGRPAEDTFAAIASRARMAIPEVDTGAVISALENWGIARNDVPNGCRYQDGSVIVCNKGRVCRHESIEVSSVAIDSHRVDARCEDAFGIALREDGSIDRVFGGALKEVRIDGEVVLHAQTPSDVYIERGEAGYRMARVDKRNVEWRSVGDLKSI